MTLMIFITSVEPKNVIHYFIAQINQKSKFNIYIDKFHCIVVQERFTEWLDPIILAMPNLSN